MIETGLSPKEKQARYWINELVAAEQREKHYRDCAKHVCEIFDASKKAENSFNIVYSNTETLLPALFNSTPRAMVSGRYKDPDPLSDAVAKVLKRGIEFQIDVPDPVYDPFDDLMESATLAALLPGRGVTWWSYIAEVPDEDLSVDPTPNPAKNAADEPSDTADPSPESEVPESALELAGKPKFYEKVCAHDVPYNHFLHGFARQWRSVPWVARLHHMSKADIRSNFGRALADKLKYEVPDENEKKKDSDKEGTAGICPVYEVWHKARMEVVYIACSHKDGPLKVVADPLQLPGFFPCTKPLQFLKKPNGLIPTTLYELYQEQARELNRVSIRINKLIEALKVRGMYHGMLKEIGPLLTKEDNTLVAATQAQALMEGAGLDKYIWTMPLDKISTVLQNLYVQREQVKRVIYEITGVSDILRGSTVASETATAQNIKNQWGTLRLRRAQRQVQLYVRENIRLMSSMMAKHYNKETWQAITGLQFGEQEQKQQAIQQLTAMQGQMQQIEQIAQQNPEAQQAMQQMQQQMQQLQQTAQMVTWEEILSVLQNDLSRAYKIDIETNSTIDPEATEDQKNVAELFGGLSQVLQAVTSVPGFPPAALKGLLIAVGKRFRFGEEVMHYFEQIADQMPQGDPQTQKMQEDLAKKEQQLKEQEAELKMEQKELELNKKMALKEIELEKREALMEIKMAQKMQTQAVQGAAKQAELNLNMRGQMQEADLAMQGEQQQQDFQVNAARERQAMAGEAQKRDLAFQGKQQQFRNEQKAKKPNGKSDRR